MQNRRLGPSDVTAIGFDSDNGYDAWAIDNSFTTQSDEPGEDTQRTAAGALRVTGELSDAVTLVSITGVADSGVVFAFDADWGNPPGWAPDVYAYTQRTDRNRRTLNQELRLVSGPAGELPGRADWVFGGYGLDPSEAKRGPGHPSRCRIGPEMDGPACAEPRAGGSRAIERPPLASGLPQTASQRRYVDRDVGRPRDPPAAVGCLERPHGSRVG